jgi:hypothetical protein
MIHDFIDPEAELILSRAPQSKITGGVEGGSSGTAFDPD